MWSVILALAIGLVYASLLYLFSKTYGKGLTILLFALRTIVVTTVVMLFINPYIKQKINKIEQPIIVFAQDNSASIVMTKDSVFYKEQYPHLIESIANTLDEKYEIDYFTFGQNCHQEISPLPSVGRNDRRQSVGRNDREQSSVSRNDRRQSVGRNDREQSVGRNDRFSEHYTNISNALNTISRQYYKKNVGAVVLLSDGIVNQGVNPELSIENYPFPIYSVTLGDTVLYPTMTITEVRYNKTVPSDMLFPLRVTVNAQNCRGEEMDVSVKMDGVEVEKAVVAVTNNRFSKTFDFNINSEKEGTKQIDIQANSSRRRIFIEVTDKKYNILCYAKAPHPDIAAIKSALDDHFEFDVVYDDNVVTNQDLPLRYDLVILHQIALKSPIPSITIIGSGTDYDTFNETQNVVTINRGATNTNLDVRARYNNNFGLFTLNSEIKKEMKTYPPLSLPHLEITFNNRHDELMLMNIMDLETQNPLISFADDANGNKMGFIFGTGCWRWKLYEYYHHKNNDGFNELFSKTIKYLLTEKDKELTVNHKESYLNTESITLTAELRNPGGELLNDADLHIMIRSAGKSYEYVFSKGDNNYNLNIGMLPEGIYSYRAHATLGGIEYAADGTFTVETVGVEAQNLTADIERMRTLAQITNGKHYYITDIQQLTKDLENDERITSIARQETRYDELINIKWLFFIILGLITIEWLLRKIFGVY